MLENKKDFKSGGLKRHLLRIEYSNGISLLLCRGQQIFMANSSMAIATSSFIRTKLVML